MLNDELDVLKMRLIEFDSYPELVTHIIVEAPMTHRGKVKPLHYQENVKTFARWSNRIVAITANELPSLTKNPDPWSREHAQREYVHRGLVNAKPDDIIIHGDVDEIPRMNALEEEVKLVRESPNDVFVLGMSLHCNAVDWVVPNGYEWKGTVAKQHGNVVYSFKEMRDLRASASVVHNGGWHISGLGGPEVQRHKIEELTCHLELPEEFKHSVASGQAYREGSLGDIQQIPLESLDDMPQYIREQHCPANWFRPK